MQTARDELERMARRDGTRARRLAGISQPALRRALRDGACDQRLHGHRGSAVARTCRCLAPIRIETQRRSALAVWSMRREPPASATSARRLAQGKMRRHLRGVRLRSEDRVPLAEQRRLFFTRCGSLIREVAAAKSAHDQQALCGAIRCLTPHRASEALLYGYSVVCEYTAVRALSGAQITGQ